MRPTDVSMQLRAAVLIGLAGFIPAAVAQSYAIDWWTVDGGGDMWTTGGDFELSGTIGQPDAGIVLTGGSYELSGGFWPGAVGGGGPTICQGDLNCDGVIDFGDINPFVLILTNPGGWQQQYPGCPTGNGDINEDGTVDFGDINPFVALLAGAGGQPIPCP